MKIKKKYRLHTDTVLNRLIAIPFYLDLLRRYNTLKAEHEELQETIKSELYTHVIAKIDSLKS